jgi:hypothetical protein
MKRNLARGESLVRRVALVSSLALSACVMGGCAAEVSAQPDPVYVTADTVPVNVETSPSVVYEGHPTYFVNNRWYYRNGSSWVYYRHEPQELVRQRSYVQRAPAAHPVERRDEHEHNGEPRDPDFRR